MSQSCLSGRLHAKLAKHLSPENVQEKFLNYWGEIASREFLSGPHSQDGLMLPWSLFAIRMTAKECVSLDTSQTFFMSQASQCHILSSTKASLLQRSGKGDVLIDLGAAKEYWNRQRFGTNAVAYDKCRIVS